MAVVIEGANFTGKTTFLESLNGKYPIYRGLASLPSSTIKLHSLSDVIASDLYAADFIRQTNTNVIFERSPLSAVIYDGLPYQYYMEWEVLINSSETIMLIFTAPDEALMERMSHHNILERLGSRGLAKEDVIQLNNEYVNYFYQKNYNVITFLIDSTDEEDVSLANNYIELNFGEVK